MALEKPGQYPRELIGEIDRPEIEGAFPLGSIGHEHEADGVAIVDDRAPESGTQAIGLASAQIGGELRALCYRRGALELLGHLAGDDPSRRIGIEEGKGIRSRGNIEGAPELGRHLLSYIGGPFVLIHDHPTLAGYLRGLGLEAVDEAPQALRVQALPELGQLNVRPILGFGTIEGEVGVGQEKFDEEILGRAHPWPPAREAAIHGLGQGELNRARGRFDDAGLEGYGLAAEVEDDGDELAQGEGQGRASTGVRGSKADDASAKRREPALEGFAVGPELGLVLASAAEPRINSFSTLSIRTATVPPQRIIMPFSTEGTP